MNHRQPPRPRSAWADPLHVPEDDVPRMVVVPTDLERSAERVILGVALAAALLGFLAGLFVCVMVPPSAPPGASPSLSALAALPGASQGQESGEVPLDAIRPPGESDPPAADSEHGIASWYCCTRGYRGTAVVAIPGARYVPVGRAPWGWANVCAFEDGTSHCGTFPIVDACGCPGERIVDLSIEAVDELDLTASRGLWKAEVTILRDGPALTLPPTDLP